MCKHLSRFQKCFALHTFLFIVLVIVLPTNAGEVHIKNNKVESDIGNIRLMSI